MFITETMRKFMQQIRQETGIRVCERVFDPNTDKPSKVCLIDTMFENIPVYIRNM